METNIIKSFLVGLGFDVDDASLAKFNKSIAMATIKVTALATAITATAAGIFKGITSISGDFEELGYSLRLVAPAVNKMLILRQAMLQAYSRAGVDLVKVVKESILFNYSLAKTKFALEAIYKSVGARFLPLLTKQMDIFRAKIFQNMPKIQAQLEKFVTFIFKAFSAVVELGTRLWSILGRVWDFFKALDEATNGWSTRIIAVIAAWNLLNLAFLATPLGMLLTGLLAILALYDDFKTFQEGGKTLFDWSSFIPVIKAVGDELKDIGGVIAGLMSTVWQLFTVFYKLFTLDFSGLKNAWAGLGSDMIYTLGKVLTLFKDVFSFWTSLSGWVSHLSGTIASGGNLTNYGSINQPTPLVAQGGGVNQKVQQQTNITVQGTADAHATGMAVASQQSNVNFDMTRNLKGATQ